MRYLLLSMFFLVSCVEAIHPEQATVSHPPARIRTLLPDLLLPLGVDPAIPDNFVAMSPAGKPDLIQGIFWGPKDVLEKYFQDPEHKLETPVIRVMLSPNVAQTHPNGFDPNMIKMWKKTFKEASRSLSMQQMHWGSYPVIAAHLKAVVKAEESNTEESSSAETPFENGFLFAYVGLNDSQGGQTLMFHLVPPTDRPLSKKDKKFWNHFLKNTRPLSDQELFLADGHDLQPGYTILDIGPLRFTLTAEKRMADGMVQLVVVPGELGSSFELQDMRECLMGANWHFGKPLLKVMGSFEGKSEEFGGFTFNNIVSILIDEVEEFSVQPNTLAADSPYQVFVRAQKELDPDAEDSFLIRFRSRIMTSP